MGRTAFLIILTVIMFSSLKAQVQFDFRQVDSITYVNTLSENWEEVIGAGKLAIENDIDYFYLRLRMGIAYFNKGNYRSASRHLLQAGKFNPDDGLTKDYLYYSFLYAGQDNKAAYVSSGLNEKMRSKYGIDRPKIISGIYIETGPEFSDNFEENELKKLPENQVSRVQDLYGNSYYAHIGFRLQLHSRISLYAGYSNLNIAKKAGLQYAWNSPDSIVTNGQGFSKFFPSKPKVDTKYYDYTLRQNSVYGKFNIQFGTWSLNPAIHYIHVNTKSISIENNTSLVRDTANYIPAQDTVIYMFYDLLSYEISPQTLKLNNYVVYLGVNKTISVFDLGAFGSWSNLNGLDQYQFGISVSYYPFGNLNFYGNTTFKGFCEESETRPVLIQMLGARLSHFLWLEGFGSFGNLRGTNESDAFIVYNLSDEIDLKTGLNLIFVITPTVKLSFRYQYLKKQGYRTVFGSGNPGGSRIEELNYSNNSIIGGLTWTF